MTFALSTMARRFAAAAMRNRERAWKGTVGQMEAGQQKTGTAAEAGSLGPPRGRDLGDHLIVIIQSDKPQKQSSLQMF
jgi:hypothetical protein